MHSRTRPPSHQCCPECSHKFKTQMGTTYMDIEARRDKILATDFSAPDKPALLSKIKLLFIN